MSEAELEDQMPENIISPICRAFLRQEYDLVNPKLDEWLKVLSEVGASECWHKKSTFKAHLFETYKICKLWGLDELLCEVMLFHSAYSNSYVNLAIFKAERDRPRLARLVGAQAEHLIHLFCVVPRHDLIVEKLLKVLPDDQLVVPPEGVTVPHIHTGDPVTVPRNVVAAFLALTMCDFSEQLMSWQDTMFENTDGKLYYAGHNAHVLWPAAMKPGLYHAALSRMGRLLRNTMDAMQNSSSSNSNGSSHDSNQHNPHASSTAAPDAQQQHVHTSSTELQHASTDTSSLQEDDFAYVQPSIPPVYDNCTAMVGAEDERRCRDLYWEVVTSRAEPEHAAQAEQMLTEACSLNPYVAEPHALLAQLLLQKGAWSEARAHARTALQLLCTWGTAWDKRMAWDAWVAWCRVLLSAATKHKWPHADQPMGMLNLGLVDGLD